MDYDAASLQLEQLQDRAHQLVKHQMEVMARDWQRCYPKRAIEFRDCMGVVNFSIDDGMWYVESCDVSYPKDDEEIYRCWGSRKLMRIFEPLYEALEWYSEWSDTFDVSIGFRLEPILQKESQ